MSTIPHPKSTKGDRVNARIPESARDEAARLREMFDAASAELTAEDREDRDLILGGFSQA